MSIPFEAKYIQVNYLNKNTIGSIKKSKYILPVEILDNNEYAIEAITYSKLDTGESGQLAFRILDDSIDENPYFVIGVDINMLLALKDPDTGHIWWIENGSWKKTENKDGKKIIYRDSVICRSVGQTKINIANSSCLIQINSTTFSYSQLDAYLEDFKASLSELIFSEDSYVSANAKEKEIKIANKELLDLLFQFIKFAEKTIYNPKKELREKQSIQNYKKVRPIPKTFMEIATQGIKKELTSRDYIESYDVAENRYIHSIVKRVYILLNTLNHITKRRIKTLKNELNNRTEKFNQLDTDKILISQEACESHILDLKKKVEKEKEKSIEINSTNILPKSYYVNREYKTYANLDTFYLKVGREIELQDETISFFGKGKVSKNDNWFLFPKGDYIKYKFENSFGDTNFIFQPYSEYEVVAEVVKNKFSTRVGGNLYVREFYNIYKISPLCDIYTLFIQVGSKPKIDDKDENIISFFGNAKQKQADYWYKLKEDELFLFKFDKHIFDRFFNLGNEYEISACIGKSSFTASDGKKIFLREFFKVDKVTILHSSLEGDLKKYSQEFEILKKNDWKRFLTDDEKEDQNREKESIVKILNLIDKTINENENIFNGFQYILPKLQKIRSFFKKNNVRIDNHFPGSMTFIQNANYLGSHKSYKQIKDASGINEDLFDIWQESEDIGILDIPTIYERWCLLQIIKILIEKYDFLPIGGEWKTNLLQQVVKNKYDIELLFGNEDTGRKIRLFYEKILDNGKRPDFIIDVRSLTHNSSKFNRFVMDAKFRENVKLPGQISDLMYQLYNDKDYSEGNKNLVYILHPAINAVKKMRTPQDWAKNSYYGEDILLDEEIYPNHKYGAILVSPFYENYNSSLDDLQRLIGLFLQYSAEDNQDLYNENSNILDTKPKENIFCLVCGSSNCKVNPKKAGRNNTKYNCTCLDCQHYFVINYCGACRNRLWKHGRYWTYHKTHAFEPYNIQCPACGELIAQRNEKEENE